MANKTTLSNLNSFDITANTINAENINTYKFMTEYELDTLYTKNLIVPNLYNIITPAYYTINRKIDGITEKWYEDKIGNILITESEYVKYLDIPVQGPDDEPVVNAKKYFYIHRAFVNGVNTKYSYAYHSGSIESDKGYIITLNVDDPEIINPNKEKTFTTKGVDIFIDSNEYNEYYVSVILPDSAETLDENQIHYFACDRETGNETEIISKDIILNFLPRINYYVGNRSQAAAEEFVAKNIIKIKYTRIIDVQLSILQLYKEYDSRKLDIENFCINGLNFNVPGGIALLDKDGNYDTNQIPKATTERYGIVKLAYPTESVNPNDNENVVTPAGLYTAIREVAIEQLLTATEDYAGAVCITSDINKSYAGKEDYMAVTREAIVGTVENINKSIKSVNDRIDNLGAVFSYQGSVKDIDELLNLYITEPNLKKGYVYNVKSTGRNYVCIDVTKAFNLEEGWDDLSADESLYLTKVESSARGEGIGNAGRPVYFDKYGIPKICDKKLNIDISGNADTATTAEKLKNNRTFSINGAVTAKSIQFNGTGDVQFNSEYNLPLLEAAINDNSIKLNGSQVSGDIPGHANKDLALTGGTMSGTLIAKEIYADKVFNAVYNDYAETFDNTDLNYNEIIHRIVEINNEGKVELAKKDSINVIGIVSDQYGHLMGGTKEDIDSGKKIPVGLAGTLYVDTKEKIDISNMGKYVASDNAGYAKVVNNRDNTVVGKIIGIDKENNRYKVIICL